MPTSMPRVGIEQQQDAAFRQQPFGDGDLLLVAAGERADPRPQRAAVDVDALEHALRPPPSRRGRRSAGREKREITGSEALCLPLSFSDSASVLRSSGTRLMPILARTASVGEAMTIGWPSTRRPPASEIGHAETGEKQIELPHALQAGDAEDLAGAQRRTRRRSSLARRRDARRRAPPAPDAARRRRGAAERRARARGRRSSRSPRRRHRPRPALVAIWPPLRSTVIVSQKSRTSRSRCEMNTVVTPFSR